MSMLMVQDQSIGELQVSAAGGQGARAMACLLADVGQFQGVLPLSMRSTTDPLKVCCPDEAETAVVRFAGAAKQGFRLTAVLEPKLANSCAEGMVLVNSEKAVQNDGVRSLDANRIANQLGVPAYLPMVGAVARMAGWSDLGRVKDAVRMALADVAPYWVEPAMAAVEAGYKSVM